VKLDADAATKKMIGNSLTHYRITAKLGEGGMGEVYRGAGTKLGRNVAIRVLPASITEKAQDWRASLSSRVA
jgi:serine/threonine protein kinase